MKEAWQFVARNASTKKTRPVGYGVKDEDDDEYEDDF
jgi:hypothetical protein